MTVRVGVAVPQVFPGSRVNSALVGEVAVLADQLGFDSLWVQEDVLGKTGTLDALTTLAFVASQTAKVDLGAEVLLAPSWEPAQLAKAITTLDQLSNRRVLVGLDTNDAAALGLAIPHRGRGLDEVVEVLAALWAGKEPPVTSTPFDHEGTTITAEPALARAGRHGDGYNSGSGSNREGFREAVERLHAQLVAINDGRPLSITKRVYLACTEHHADARRRLQRCLTDHYGDEDVARTVSVIGDVDYLIEHLSGLVEDGADELILNFVFEENLAVEAAAHDILPALRRQHGRWAA
jgi:alkanesulfonate monooxygenase SsuD/methylene tetrahydromethanopterin reductase-like flavin-dependent oxidoreductase (luciferase family)